MPPAHRCNEAAGLIDAVAPVDDGLPVLGTPAVAWTALAAYTPGALAMVIVEDPVRRAWQVLHEPAGAGGQPRHACQHDQDDAHASALDARRDRLTSHVSP